MHGREWSYMLPGDAGIVAACCGLPALYGRAAVFRAMYTGHGVLALNFMRHKVEAAIDSGLERFG